jgi:DNA-binding transcriptional ArsR family regulator
MLTGPVREQALALVGRALADDSRRRILLALADRHGYPAELAQRLGLSRSNVSNHLACLRDCGLVVPRFEGRRIRYELADPRIAPILGDLMSLVLVAARGTV